MIDHVGLSVEKYEEAKAFYIAVLKPLGYELVAEFLSPASPQNIAGFGKNDKGDFWISEEGKTTPHTHIAFVAESRGDVDAFYEAAIHAGGIDNGKPGVRAEYHPHYYGAFVIDPEGHNIEAVCHKEV
ncbi:VOC family protein [Patescibacteria group bacterium]|nr:VOC family protein [Patescibacteria group bacterium]